MKSQRGKKTEAVQSKNENDLRESAKKYLSDNNYKKYLDCLKSLFELTSTEEDKKELEKAKNLYEISLEINEILKSDHDDYYKLLGVNENSSVEEIKKAFRAKAYRYHPDRVRIEGAANAMRIIQKAYFEINTEKKKRSYDSKKKIPKIFRNMVYTTPQTRTAPEFTRFSRPFFNYTFSNSNSNFYFTSNFGSFESFEMGSNPFFGVENFYRNLYRNSRRQNLTRNQNVLVRTYAFYLITLFIIVLAIL